MHKNSEGHQDIAQENAINGAKREKQQQALERKHGLKRGQKIVIETTVREENYGKKRILKKAKYTVKELYPHCVLLADRKEIRFCPSYEKLKELMRGGGNA